jgi:hypothetical protein
VLTEGHGIPPTLSQSGGNRNDITQLIPLLDAVRPSGTPQQAQVPVSAPLVLVGQQATSWRDPSCDRRIARYLNNCCRCGLCPRMLDEGSVV